MTKIAAAIPAIMAAATPQMLASIAMAAAAGGIDAYGRRQTQKTNDAANQQWLAYQDRKENAARLAEERGMKKAQSSLDQYLDTGTGEARAETIDTEADRLSGEFEQGLDEGAANVIASDPGAGRSDVFDEALAKSINTATTDARKRMQALARASAYGGSSGGMSMNDATRGMTAGTQIGNINMARGNNISALQRYQAVQPEIFEYRQSPMVPILQAGSMLMGGMDPSKMGSWGTSVFANGANAANPALTGFRPIARPANLGGTAVSTAGSPTGGGLSIFNPAVPDRGFSFMRV